MPIKQVFSRSKKPTEERSIKVVIAKAKDKSCFVCKEEGHFKADCPKRANKVEKTPQSNKNERNKYSIHSLQPVLPTKCIVVIKGERIEATEDNGAAVSVINGEIARRLSLVKKKNVRGLTLQDANGNQLDITTSTVELKVILDSEEKNCIHTIAIADDSPFEFLVGKDLLNKLNIVSDHGSDKLYFKNKTRPKSTGGIYTVKAATIPKLSSEWVEVDFAGKPESGDVLVSPDKRTDRALTPYGVCDGFKQKSILISNPTKHDIILRQKERMASWSDLKKINDRTNKWAVGRPDEERS